jgi:hypothetical protein
MGSLCLEDLKSREEAVENVELGALRDRECFEELQVGRRIVVVVDCLYRI